MAGEGGKEELDGQRWIAQGNAGEGWGGEYSKVLFKERKNFTVTVADTLMRSERFWRRA